MSDEADPVSEDPLAAEPVIETAYGVAVTESFGDPVLHPTVDAYIETIEALRAHGFTMLIDLCGVDYLTFDANRGLPPTVEPQRFEVVSSYICHDRVERIRVRVQVADGGSVPTLFDIFPGSEALEREAADLFGIIFDNHPDPSRILMPEDWEGHPLRKDYAIGKIPVQFKGAPTHR